MDKETKAPDYSWLPAQMPRVAAMVAEYRSRWGAKWVAECWRRGVLELQPGWFYAAEGALAVGVLWDDPDLLAFATARLVPRGQVLVMMRPPQEAASATATA